MTKFPTPIEKSKKQRDTPQYTPPKPSISQRLWTDLGQSVEVTIVTPLVQYTFFYRTYPRKKERYYAKGRICAYCRSRSTILSFSSFQNWRSLINYLWSKEEILISDKQNRVPSEVRDSKSRNMKSSGENGLKIRTLASPKRNMTRCQEEKASSSHTRYICSRETSRNLVIRSKLAIRSRSLKKSDQWTVWSMEGVTVYSHVPECHPYWHSCILVS